MSKSRDTTGVNNIDRALMGPIQRDTSKSQPIPTRLDEPNMLIH